MSQSMKAEPRNAGSKGSLRALRMEGKVPGVVYGTDIEATPIAVSTKELLALLREGGRGVMHLELKDKVKRPVLISDVQRDKVSRDILHIDFHHIDMNDPIVSAIPISIKGTSPGVEAGGMLQIQLHQLEVRCLPEKMPDSLEVDISSLQVGESLSAAKLKLPEGVELKTESESVVVTVLAPQKEEATETGDVGESVSEDGPEVAGEQKA